MKTDRDVEIRELKNREIDEALDLVWTVFREFEAPDYSEEGVTSFHEAINDPAYIKTLRFYGAFEEGDLAGIIASRCGGTHIALFFVKKELQNRGIGRGLMNALIMNSDPGIITVNSAPYAVKMYHKMGFADTGEEQTRDGIRYTPMSVSVRAYRDIRMMLDRDNNKAYRSLLEMENRAQISEECYPFLGEFMKMLDNRNSYVRVRGFRMICALSRWDGSGAIDGNIQRIMAVIDDDKATAVRQYLKALNTMVMFKPGISDAVKEKLSAVDCSRYNESMAYLIRRDIEALLLMCDAAK